MRTFRALVPTFLLLLLVFGVPAFVAPWHGWFRSPGELIEVEIPRGTSQAGVAAELEKAGLIESPRQFRLLARLHAADEPIQAGRYALRRDDAWKRWIEAMQAGKVVRLTLTIPEGTPSILIAERLLANTALTGPVNPPAEGAALPETYDFAKGEARSAVVDRMTAAMDRTLAELWPRRTSDAVVKTPQEALILASIVEKETGKGEERRMIAGVYSNRLRIGMKLDADPTVIYPVTKGKPLGRRILRSELDTDNGYNTYLKPGLPAGPIANPGRASIEAVLDPAKTDALYFVADGSGGHVFAATLAEHNTNVARWYALRRSRGEM
ncbi:UPF0755 protein [Polymorphobacter multimanifer]|uniref:Endolytic murein transglycosylase n=1 Tax=Polymorphobacter multimanifer TaxID=1070431 RepID=A0A841LCY2_9SPHN|nr:endolytic transglycosylase MltG [Polymorphobacter multimanifer]MBB6227675.1 UPF0755 protein [Polymorphobacter multimanifer]